MYRLFLLLAFSLQVFFSQGQSVSGIVLSANSNQAIPFANVSVKGTSVGTISNNEGFFSLNIPEQYRHDTLVVSFMGYNNEERYIETITRPITIKLKEAQLQLSEVKVMPDSTMYTFLKKAYKKIPINYSNQPTLLTGFYREVSQDTFENYLYFAEAILDVHKTSYQNKQQGQIELIESRKRKIPGKDTITDVKMYGGAFIPHNKDIVHERKGAIKPSNFKHFVYDYLGKSIYNNHEVHGFNFVAIDDSLQRKVSGKFFIDAQSYAFVYYEHEQQGSWVTTNPFYLSQYEKVKILYAPYNDEWFLKAIRSERRILDKRKQTQFWYKLEYLTSDVTFKDVKTLSYTKQMDLNDIFADEADPYEETNWKDYNIIAEDEVNNNALEFQFSSVEANKVLSTSVKDNDSKLDKFMLLMKSFRAEYGFGYQGYKFPIQQVDLSINASDTQHYTKAVGQDLYALFNVSYGFYLKKIMFVSYNYHVQMGKSVLNKSNQIMFGFNACVKRRGFQLFAEPNIAYAFNRSGYSIGDYSGESDLILSDKTLDKDRTALYVGSKHQDVTLGLNIKAQVSPLLILMVGASYQHRVMQEDGLLAIEKKLLYNRKGFESFGESVAYYEDNIAKTNTTFILDPWFYKLAIMFSF